MEIRSSGRSLLFLPVLLCAFLAGGATRIVQDQCGPFTDVTPAFCPYILELYYLGITAGTSATTFSPDDPLTRGQGAVFIAKGLNQSLARSSRRAALGQWGKSTFTNWLNGLAATALPDSYLEPVVCDGSDVWVGGLTAVFRVRASDGKLLDSWAVENPLRLLVAMGRIFAEGGSGPFDVSLFMFDPSGPAGPATAVTPLPGTAWGLAFDGARIWTVNIDGSVSIITPGSSIPWTATTVALGLQTATGIVFDGQNIWVSDSGACTLSKLDAAGGIVQAVDLSVPNCTLYAPIFDGANIVVPAGDALKVVRASDGTLAATIPVSTGAARIAFDGERLLVESDGGGQNAPRGLTLLRAADFAPLQIEGFPPIGSPGINGIAADGINFWVTFNAGSGTVLARY